MALSSQTYRTEFTCTGGTTYDFLFKVFDDDDLEVIRITAAGVESTLTKTTNYSVSGLSSTGGTVTTVSTYSDGKLVVRRKQAATQDADFTQNDIFSTAVLEDQLDKIVMMVQDLKEKIARSLLGAATQTTAITFPSADADKMIGWNGAGTGLENKTYADATLIPIDTDTALTADSDAKVASQKATKAYADTKTKYADTRFKVGTFARSVATAAGDTSYTGVGFQPKAIEFMFQMNTLLTGHGFDDATKHLYTLRYGTVPGTSFGDGYSIFVYDDAVSGSCNALVKTFDADGFTLTWGLGGGAITGSVNVGYIAYR